MQVQVLPGVPIVNISICMKFHNTVTYANLDKFELVRHSRNLLDLILLHKVVYFSNRQLLLEIGYLEGRAFGMLYESSTADAKLVACDIRYDKDKFTKFYPTITKECEFRTCKSTEFDYNYAFDFAELDGSHEYTDVMHELSKLDDCMTTDAIIMVDDYCANLADNEPNAGVEQALVEFLSSGKWVPLLVGPQQMFMVRTGYDHSCTIDAVYNSVKKIASWSKQRILGYDTLMYQYKHAVFVNKLASLVKDLDV